MENLDKVKGIVSDIVKRQLVPFVTKVVANKDKSYTLKISGRQGKITGFGLEINESNK